MRLNLLLPARKRVESATVAHWLARGNRLPDAAPGREAVLRECFETGVAELPAAALTRQADVGDAADATWLRADPAFVMADAVTLRLLACGNLGLSTEDVDACAEALQPLFEDAGFTFDTPHPQRWYLRCPPDAKLPTFSSPDEALGDDLANHLPEGKNARPWRSLLNEVQIVLTQHPVNAQRAQRGLPLINSLWFWGAGALPGRVECRFDQVVSNDGVVTSLAALAGASSFPPKREFSFSLFHEHSKLDSRLTSHSAVENHGNDEQERARSVLIDLANQRDPVRLDDDWLVPIADAFHRRQVAQLDLRFESGERYIFKPSHHWRFWRRVNTAT